MGGFRLPPRVSLARSSSFQRGLLKRRNLGRLGLVLSCASCGCAASGLLLLACVSAFVPGSSRLPAALGSQRASGTTPTQRSASDPWKPLVFKMPRPRPPREIKDEDDEFTVSMRKRFEGLTLQEEKARTEARSVSESKIDDLILKETDDAKINARYALWRMDREKDRIRQEAEKPSLEQMRARFQERVDHLDGKGAQDSVKEQSPEGGSRSGFLEPARSQSFEELLEAARSDAANPASGSHGAADQQHDQSPLSGTASNEEDEEWGQDYLEAFQARSAKEDKLSRRVVKSPDERRQDYETEKANMFLFTSGLGVIGSASSMVFFGQNEAFGFFLGTIGALLYLSGLANYADNAESPLGTALGGRRFLVPVLLVLLVIQWYKLENMFPVVASLHLAPSLPAAIFGFFTYVVGQVAAGLMKSVPAGQVTEDGSRVDE